LGGGRNGSASVDSDGVSGGLSGSHGCAPGQRDGPDAIVNHGRGSVVRRPR